MSFVGLKLLMIEKTITNSSRQPMASELQLESRVVRPVRARSTKLHFFFCSFQQQSFPPLRLKRFHNGKMEATRGCSRKANT